MIEVKVINKEKVQTHGGVFKSVDLANEWISRVEGKTPCPWGEKGSYNIQITDKSADIALEEANRAAERAAMETIKAKAQSRSSISPVELAQAVEFLLKRAGI